VTVRLRKHKEDQSRIRLRQQTSILRKAVPENRRGEVKSARTRAFSRDDVPFLRHCPACPGNPVVTLANPQPPYLDARNKSGHDE